MVREVKRSGESNEKLIEKLVQLEGEVKRLRDAREAEAELADERERGTGKGRAFEQQAFELVEQMARARGDVAHHVGDERSASGGKRGDIVIEIDAAGGPRAAGSRSTRRTRSCPRTRPGRSSTPRSWSATPRFAILVVATDEKVPSGREPLHEYEGNKMIVTLDKETFDGRALELAYRYARCRCLMALERELAIDAPGVRDAAEEALSALKQAQSVRSSLTGARKSVDGAREALDGMVGRVEASLERIESLISSADALD